MPKAKSAPKKKILLFQIIEAILCFTNLNLGNIADKAFGYLRGEDDLPLAERERASPFQFECHWR
jgi:hypothetical protein